MFSLSELSLEQCVGVCIDGSASMTAKHYEAVARIKKIVQYQIQTHCMINREVLVAKHLGQPLTEILFFCVKIVNSIKILILQYRMFLKLCDDLGSEHTKPFAPHESSMTEARKNSGTGVSSARRAFNSPSKKQFDFSFISS